MSLFSKFLVFVSRLSASIALTAMAASASHAALVRTVEAGKLTGATGVDVGGVLYDVKFVDGTCVALFSGCDDVSDFAFTTQAGAVAAAQALFNQVLLDVGVGQEFDTRPELTTGCSAAVSVICWTFTPWGFPEPGKVVVTGAYNAAPAFTTDFLYEDYSIPTTFDSTRDSTNWAVWTPTATVPEPSSLALLSVAGVALIWSQRRRQLRANSRTH